MNKVFILVLIAILQLTSSLIFSCEIDTVRHSNASSLKNSLEKNQNRNTVSIENKSESHEKNMSDSHQGHCIKCTSCNELLGSSINVEINFSIATFTSLEFNYSFSYKQPIINFYQKPPVLS